MFPSGSLRHKGVLSVWQLKHSVGFPGEVAVDGGPCLTGGAGIAGFAFKPDVKLDWKSFDVLELELLNDLGSSECVGLESS